MSARAATRNSLLLLLALAAACGGRGEPDPKAEARRAMARGIGFLESFLYGEARSEFRRAIELDPAWTDARVNYAIALLNSTADETAEEDLAGRAVEVVREVLKAEPDNDQARFILGFLLLYRKGDPVEALESLRRVREPDASVLYWIAKGEVDRGDLDAALRAYEQALALDRHLVSAWYGRFLCLTRLGKQEEAEKALAEWERVKAGGATNAIGANAYPEIGRYALAVRRYGPTPPPARTFSWSPRPGGDLAGFDVPGAAAIGIADVDGDGDLDLYLPGALFLNEGGLRFRRAASLPAMPGLFFDFDGDERPDLFLYGEGPDRLYRGSGGGAFEEVAAWGDGQPHHSRFALSADLDMDGDVDLFVTEEAGPARLLRNNRDGTFQTMLLGKTARGRGALVADFDRDLDPDLLMAVAEGPPRRFRNDRADGFAEIEPAALGDGRALLAADVDRDGREEVKVLAHPVLAADVDLDGALDLVDLPEDRSASCADLDGDGTPEIVAVGKEGRIRLLKAEVRPGRWVAFDLRGGKNFGGEQGAPPMGPGSQVETLSGGLWQLQVARSVSGFAGQHAPWVTFGLGEASVVDVLRLVWPDRVLQAEMDIPAGAVKVLREVNRKPSSCPLLFADGPDGPRFLTDFLGSGGLGFFLAPGVYGKPDPDEVVHIGALQPVAGEYVLRVLEPLEEVSYLDEATLLAVDHPEGMEVFANERFAGEEPFPEFRIWEIAERIAPAAVSNDRGQDCLAAVAAVDRRYPPILVDRRFEGFAREHWIACDFTGRVPRPGAGERLVLLLDGWVEYGYSHSNLAAAQAGVLLAPPVLERREGEGWRVAIPNTGYPAGLPRTMTLDVTGVVTPEHPVFRLRTNLEVYWDRVTLGVDRGGGRAVVTRLAPASANLRERGYPREYSPDGGIPRLYDYGLMDPGYPFKIMRGSYTRFGEVTPLLHAADDRYVIFGKGEEVTLRYAATGLPTPADGMRRTFMLYAVGWCKDMDPYTAFPDTVEPLPFRGMSNYPYPPTERCPAEAADATWNSRRY